MSDRFDVRPSGDEFIVFDTFRGLQTVRVYRTREDADRVCKIQNDLWNEKGF